MKLFDKIKDLFMDEVAEDDEIEFEEEEEEKKEEPPKPKKEERVLPSVMRETIKEEEKKKEEKSKPLILPEDFITDLKETKPVTEPKIVDPPKKFSFPIDLDDNIPSRNSKPVAENVSNQVNNRHNVNVLDVTKEATKKVVELYPKKEEVKEKPKFKATPVISPVYGILDKNYKKEEVKERDEVSNLMKRPSKKVDFETVRKKAFGNLADEIKDNLLCENCELYKEVKKISALKEDDLLYDMTVDDDDEKDVTIAKAYDNYEEFGVAYEPKVERKTVVNADIHIEEKVTSDLEAKEELPVEEDKTNLDDIINNSQKIDDAVINDHEEEETVVLDKPIMTYSDKVEKDDDDDDDKSKDTMPSRSEKKKETKVDDDFFELIDSMYKERTDD